MAVPKRRTSTARKNKRRANFKLTKPNLIDCSQCGEKVISHRVCPSCGYYDKKKVMEVN